MSSLCHLAANSQLRLSAGVGHPACLPAEAEQARPTPAWQTAGSITAA